MCGVYGYIGKNNASKEIREGLQRLEYRGYDSWGVAVIKDDQITLEKNVGQVPSITSEIELPDTHIGIGHTRWATHGGVTVTNAHPHLSTDNHFSVAQNGIVENYQELKHDLLKKGYKFISQTDTEVIVRLIEETLKTEQDFVKAVQKAFLQLKGRNTIIALDSEHKNIVAIKKGSPLAYTESSDEKILSSDTLSFTDKTDKAVILEDNQMVVLNSSGTHFFDVQKGEEIIPTQTTLDNSNFDISKGNYDHYMIKEIEEQQHTLISATQYSEEDLAELIKYIKNAQTVYITGSGTASFAAYQIAFMLRKIAGIKAIDLKAYESENYKDILTDKDFLIAVSQSGETADTLEIVKMAKDKGLKVASIVNMLGSTISRVSDLAFLTRSGPEICVASTKAFTAQISWGSLVAYTIAGKHKEIKKEISLLSENLYEYFNAETYSKIKDLVNKIENKEHFFILGREQNYSIALEGALKIKEITYKHFEGIGAGELKHGIIALVDKGTPIFVIVSEDDQKENMLSAAAEVKARGAYVIGVASENNELFDFHLPTVTSESLDFIAKVIPFQLTSYFLGLKLDRNIDKPRNLAKSVTVK